MLDSHSSLGIAQTIFYAPIVPLVIFLMIRNGKIRPRMAWYPLIPFSLMRLVGGIITILAEKKKDNIGLFIAALVLLNVGVVPLIIADLGLTRIILMDNYSHNPNSAKIAKVLRIAFTAAAILLAAGGGLSSTNRSISKILSLVGYVLFAVVLATLIAMQVYFFQKKSTLLPASQKVLSGALLASPFLALRTVYGLIETSQSGHVGTTWSPLQGSAVAFALMALLPEYVVISTWIFVGLGIPPDRGVPVQRAADDADKV